MGSATTQDALAMTPAARRVLAAALDSLPDFPRGGWEHYYTAIGDEGVGTFSYDRAPEDGAGWLTVDSTPAGVVVRESFYDPHGPKVG